MHAIHGARINEVETRLSKLFSAQDVQTTVDTVVREVAQPLLERIVILEQRPPAASSPIRLSNGPGASNPRHSNIFDANMSSRDTPFLREITGFGPIPCGMRPQPV